MNKKGATEEVLEQIPYILMTIIVMAALYFLLSYYSQTTVDVVPIQANVFLYRMIYQPNGISYTDNLTGRVYPGIIDANKFSTSTLDNSTKYEYNKQVMARFSIYTTDTNEKITEAYYNQEWYNRLEPIALSRVSGASGAQIFEKNIPIIYRKEMVDSPATMNVRIIIPN